MIKANELRIGNYLRCNDIEMSSYFIINKIDISIISDFIEPIPLTEEILLKCGFEKSNDLDEFYHLDLLNEWTRIYFNPKYKVCTLSINQHDSRISIQYLHELQNLVFSLTQKELIIQHD